MKRFGLALTLLVAPALAAPGVVDAAPTPSTLVAKAKNRTKKKPEPAAAPDEKGAEAESSDEKAATPPPAAQALEEAPAKPAPARARNAAGGRAPMVVALVGANTRTRTSDVGFFDGSNHYSRNWIYPEISLRGLVRPWASASGFQRNLRFDAEFARSVAGKATSDTAGAGSFGVSSWRLALDATCLLDRLIGAWDLGAQVGLGVDAFNIDASNPDYVPSNRLMFLRLGVLGRLPVGERVYLDAMAAYHLMLGLGLSGRGANYGDSSGEHGADATAGLSGDVGLGGVRLVWSLRLTYQLHRAELANSNAVSFWQNDVLASAQLGATFL